MRSDKRGYYMQNPANLSLLKLLRKLNFKKGTEEAEHRTLLREGQ